MDWSKVTTRRDEKHFSFGICCALGYKLDGISAVYWFKLNNACLSENEMSYATNEKIYESRNYNLEQILDGETLFVVEIQCPWHFY